MMQPFTASYRKPLKMENLPINNLLLGFFLTSTAVFLQAVATPESPNAHVIDVLNVIINAVTLGALGIIGNWLRSKIKKFISVYESVSTFMPKVEEMSKSLQRVEEMSKSLTKIESDVQTIKNNTDREVQEMKERYLDVMNRIARLENKITDK